MQVKGDVRRTAGSETVDAAIGNVGGNAMPKPAKPVTVASPKVAKPAGGDANSSTSANTIVRDATLSDSVATRAAIHAEELLGGDGAYVEDFPGSPAVDDDETFAPVVVGADEVGEDPTFGADFGGLVYRGIGRLGGGNIADKQHLLDVCSISAGSYDDTLLGMGGNHSAIGHLGLDACYAAVLE